MPTRTAPYPAYNYLVNLNGPRDPGEPLGGFSEVKGLNAEIHVSEYRNGNQSTSYVQKIPGSAKCEDVSCRRGLVDSTDLWAWFVDTQTNGISARRNVTITLRDEANNPVQKWTLRNAFPRKLNGPDLMGKGGGDVAMEELVLAIESFEISAL
jgi:phage tail-like protein